MIQWLALTPEQRKRVIISVATRSGLPEKAVEKDWWVTMTLKALFTGPSGERLLFKGGTSLSKSWKLIQRFSEDIDIALNRESLGFSDGPISGAQIENAQIEKLRKAACDFTKTTLKDQLFARLIEMGIPEPSFRIFDEEGTQNADPQKLIVIYASLFDPNPYVIDQVIVEVSARSLREPFTLRRIDSFIDEYSLGTNFAQEPFDVPTVNPERTILEKAFLLHEEFCKPLEKIKHERKSRHFHDLHETMDTEYGERAMTDTELYKNIVTHRSAYNKIPGIDYNTLLPQAIDFIPPKDTWKQWEEDYESMRQHMIIGESPSFAILMERMEELRGRFRKISLPELAPIT